MIIILGDQQDHSTYDIINWLSYYRISFLLINKKDIIEIQRLTISNNGVDFIFKVKSKVINYDDISEVWYRRGINHVEDRSKQINNKSKIYKDIKNHLREEYKYLSNAVYYLFEKKSSISTFFNKEINKIQQLIIAKESGLKIPDTHIISTNNELKKLQLKAKFITKSIQNLPFYNYKGNKYIAYTEELPENKIELRASFFPSLLQNKIEKELEIRVFFIKGVSYSMAIFSQLDKKTQIDFRKYNVDTPNRVVPYKLPETIAKKIQVFMNSIQLNNGSLDFILGKDKEYYFLEVNPVGQFGMVSYPCNYYLEKKIVKHLNHNNYEEENY